MMKRRRFLIDGFSATLMLCVAGVALAHDPDEQEIEVPEVSVRAERPMAASSQQFIPDKEIVDRKSTRLNSSHIPLSRMPSSA